MKTEFDVPEAKFISDVGAYIKLQNEDVQTILKKLNEIYNKYKFVEVNLLTKKKNLKGKVPDLENSVTMIDMLAAKHESQASLDTILNLANNLYCNVTVPPTEKVGLWLGANIMLEFPLDEAKSELKKSLKDASESLKQIDKDIDFLQKQITTIEVNMARVYNYDVKQRQLGTENGVKSSDMIAT